MISLRDYIPRIERNVWCSYQYLKTKPAETAQIANSENRYFNFFTLAGVILGPISCYFIAIIITFNVLSIFNDTCKGLTGNIVHLQMNALAEVLISS